MEENMTSYFVKLSLVGVVVIIVLFTSVLVGADFRFLSAVVIVGVMMFVINHFRGRSDQYT